MYRWNLFHRDKQLIEYKYEITQYLPLQVLRGFVFSLLLFVMPYM